MTFRVALYKGTRPGIPGLYNRLVRARGRGAYSHMELVFSDGLSASSSFADGGVRFKRIDYTGSRDWDFTELPDTWERAARAYFEKRAAAKMKYDLMGNVHLAFGFLPNSPDREFCSESVMGALGFLQPFRYEPNCAYVTVLRAVEMHRLATMSLVA